MRALLFDVFGTCVDWRASVIREAARFGLPPETADKWRAQYQPQLETVRSGARPWVNLDVLHRIGLDRVLSDLGLSLGEQERAELTLVWHRLDPWLDVVEGLTRLKARYVIAPCSNGHIAQSVNLAKYAGLPWDVILGAEIARAYKPDPRVYLASVAREAAALGLPGEAVADAWRGRYQPQLETVRSGAREWVGLDVLHREALDDVLAELGLQLDPEQRDELTLARQSTQVPKTSKSSARTIRQY